MSNTTEEKEEESVELTLMNAKHSVVNYFEHKTIIEPESDFGFIDFECNDKQTKIALIDAALQSFEESGFVTKLEVGKKRKWILNRPLNMSEQTITLSYQTANIVAKVINSFCKGTNNTRDYSDVTNITERDIEKLVLIVDSIIPHLEKKS